MFFRSFKLFTAALMTVLLLAACGSGGPAPAPTGLTVVAGESSATVSWDMVAGVEYWVFVGPSSLTPATTSSMQGWFGLPGGNVVLKVSSPYLMAGLANGVSYSFSVNGRTDSGAGGPGAPSVSVTPRLAGANWVSGPPLAGGNDLLAATFGSKTTTTTSGSVTASTLTSTTYVAAGSGGAIYYSNDGTTWTSVNYPTGATFHGAAFATNYKVVGDGGVVLTSPDAVTWTAQNSGTSKNLYAITSNLVSLNVAVGAGGTIITSPDAVTWTPATNSGTTSDLYAVSYSNYNGGTWIAVGAGGTMVKSVDGVTWQPVANNTSVDLYGITYGFTSLPTATTATTAFVAVGAYGTVLISTDGVSWATQTLPGDGTLNAVTYGTQFVVVGAGGNIFTSIDGVNWSLAPAATGQDLYAVVRGSLAYLAVGAAGSNLLSK